jgi:hypothetical protein
MPSAVCWKCVEDKFLSEQIKREGEHLECSVCGETHRGFSVQQLAEVLAPILREQIETGEQMPHIDDNDHTYYEQQGDDLGHWVQTILDQYFDFNDEIVDAVIAGEDVDVRDGDIPFFDNAANYEEIPVSLQEYEIEWASVLQELKHSRRFFSTSAQDLFKKLFREVEAMKAYGHKNANEPVVWTLPKGFPLHRARTCASLSQLEEFHAHPMESVGPPPASVARAGRMNVEGVVVFYGATDGETCLAEMRPALGGDTAVIDLKTTRALKVLDFTRLEKSHGVGLSYFQPDFNEEAERLAFLRRLHNLISHPVVPGREADYLITQTMAEYLAHVHHEPFDGIMFKSVQRAGGINVVLFGSQHDVDESSVKIEFPLAYVENSLKLFVTNGIQYAHRQKRFKVDEEGGISLPYDEDDQYLLDG